MLQTYSVTDHRKRSTGGVVGQELAVCEPRVDSELITLLATEDVEDLTAELVRPVVQEGKRTRCLERPVRGGALDGSRKRLDRFLIVRYVFVPQYLLKHTPVLG